MVGPEEGGCKRRSGEAVMATCYQRHHDKGVSKLRPHLRLQVGAYEVGRSNQCRGPLDKLTRADLWKVRTTGVISTSTRIF